MKRLLLVPFFALSLVGCGTTGGIDQTKVNETIADIQATASTICSFVPTIATVSAILAVVGVPSIGMVPEIATQICGAVTASVTARRARARAVAPHLVLRGKYIPIKGKFVSPS